MREIKVHVHLREMRIINGNDLGYWYKCLSIFDILTHGPGIEYENEQVYRILVFLCAGSSL